MKLLLIPIMVLMLSGCTVETSWSLHEKQMAKMDKGKMRNGNWTGLGIGTKRLNLLSSN